TTSPETFSIRTAVPGASVAEIRSVRLTVSSARSVPAAINISATPMARRSHRKEGTDHGFTEPEVRETRSRYETVVCPRFFISPGGAAGPRVSRDELDRARLLPGGLDVQREEVCEETRDLRILGPSEDRMAGGRVELDSDAAVRLRPVRHVGEARIHGEVGSGVRAGSRFEGRARGDGPRREAPSRGDQESGGGRDRERRG